MIYYITYVSAASEKFNESQLVQLLSKSRKSNRITGVTGLLLYCDGDFIQTLEGDEKQVKNLFQIIKHDFRHTCVIKITEGFCNHRKFKDWSMGFHRASEKELKSIDGLKNFSKKELFTNVEAEENHPAVIAIQSFYENLPVHRKVE